VGPFFGEALSGLEGAMSYWYLGSPYSKYPSGLEAAFEAACRARGLLVLAGISCFSPIVHSHQVAKFCGIDPHAHDIWLPTERPMMKKAKGLIVLRLVCWETSYGLGIEIKAFRKARKPIVYMDPGVVPDELWSTK
jgi:hypothetical protein